MVRAMTSRLIPALAVLLISAVALAAPGQAARAKHPKPAAEPPPVTVEWSADPGA